MSIITITGDLASGKSLVAKQMAKELGSEYFSTGSIQREIAAKYRMTTLELNQYSENHPEIDQEIDDRVRALRNSDKDLVVDSRMAWHFLPNSFKIFLSTNIVRAAERVIADNERSNEPVYADRNDAMLKLKERKHSENKRYLHLYQADCSNLSNFDLVVDTTYSIPNETIQIIRMNLENWLSAQPWHHYWYSPRSLLPLRSLSDFAENDSPEHSQAVQALTYQGDLYVYSGYTRLFDALESGLPYLPVEMVATKARAIPDASSVADYLRARFHPQILAEWEQRFAFRYLELSGRFSERNR